MLLFVCTILFVTSALSKVQNTGGDITIRRALSEIHTNSLLQIEKGEFQQTEAFCNQESVKRLKIFVPEEEMNCFSDGRQWYVYISSKKIERLREKFNGYCVDSKGFLGLVNFEEEKNVGRVECN
jgi:hypothetical protein